MILKNVVRLVLVGLFMASVCVNVVTVSGCLNSDRLVREKGDVIERFETRVRELEAANKHLSTAQEFLETRLDAYSRKTLLARGELTRILADYNKLKREEQP